MSDSRALFEDIQAKTATSSLAELMALSLLLAQELSNNEFEKWVRLELDGYLKSNPFMSESVTVPDYRKVVGQYTDEWGTPLIVPDGMQFVNEYPLRHGVAELEEFAKSQSMLTLQDPAYLNKLNSELRLQMVSYRFSPRSISGILSAIRTRLISWLRDLKPMLPASAGVSASVTPFPTLSKDVFIVHGRDAHLKEATARFIRELGLNPVILHEQPNMGRTIIQKFNDYARSAAYAVVLLTPDDLGKLASDNDAALQNRPRQNVLLELGFFLGVMQNRVCAVKMGSMELPSDYDGVLYVQYDDNGMWKIQIAREIKALGIPIDTSKLI